MRTTSIGPSSSGLSGGAVNRLGPTGQQPADRQTDPFLEARVGDQADAVKVHQ
jgi:hypothetical protein